MTAEAVRSIPFLRRLAQEAPWGMACLDADLRFTVCNDLQAAYFGASVQDIIGRTLSEVVPANSAFCRDIERVVATGEDYPQAALSVTWSDRPEEGEHHFLVGYVAEKDEAGRVVGVFITAREVTERLPADESEKRERERLTLVNRALEDALKEKDVLLGAMSHELRTPLTTIYGNSELLLRRLDDLDKDSRERAIRDIREEAEHLNRVVESLLLLARASLHAPIDTEPVLLGSFVRHVIASRADSARGRVITVSEKPSGLIVNAKPIYLEQVLENLLANAVKYSPPSQAIEIRIRRNGNAVQISVLDRGLGLKPGEREIVFQAFYRTPAAIEKAEGAGIGLAVCKLLVQAQSGRIWAHPRRGGGAAFRFTLPAYDEARDAAVLA